MRKANLAILLLLVAAAFLAGYWMRSNSAVTSGAPAASLTPGPVEQSDKSATGEAPARLSGTVEINPEKQQLLGVRTAVVERAPSTFTLRVLGRVAADETRLYRINAAVDGWIRETFNHSTGDLVKKDEQLATFFSPEFRSAQQSYIFALGAMDRFKEQGKDTPGQTAATQYTTQQYIDTLKNIGMSDTQIAEIARTRQISQTIAIRSPAAGFIVARNITLGQKFDKGTELFRIADLSRVWILADVFENEAQYLKPGMVVQVTHPQQKKIFQAKVSNVLPQFDPATRTLKVRLIADNPGYVLRPDMFVDVELPVSFPAALTVPSDAVLDSGARRTVFVDRGGGYFEPREVETGQRFGNRIEIVKGLEPGEKIVVSGNFLIDSESKTELALSGMSGTLATDPACGGSVSMKKAEKAGMKSVYRGKTYYFASDECRQKFEKEPDRYLKQPVE